MMQTGACDCTDCKVRIELEERGRTAGLCDAALITDIIETIDAIRYGSVELKIQDSRVVQIDMTAKRRVS